MIISVEVDIIIVTCSILIRTNFLLMDKLTEKTNLFILFKQRRGKLETFYLGFYNEGKISY